MAGAGITDAAAADAGVWLAAAGDAVLPDAAGAAFAAGAGDGAGWPLDDDSG